MDNSFIDMGLDKKIIEGLKKQYIFTPTKIQSDIFKYFIDNKDIVGMSFTGSGKTLAYLLPLFMKIDLTLRSTQAIILTPTHELSAQVYKQIELLAKNSGFNIRSALIIGGANINRQIEKLKEKPQIVVGSAGRILDMIKRKKIQAHTVKTIVIDEADRMIDDLNIECVEKVIKTTLRDRQLVLLSASITNETSKRALSIMKEPIFINVSDINKLPKNIEHIYIYAEQREKIKILRKLINGEKIKKGIVFINNNENINVIVEKLNYHNIKAVGIYGKANKYDRRDAIEAITEGRVNILVSSDISSRGLDIKDVTHIINMDIPEEPIYYIHRAGRTGRAENFGKCISLVNDYEVRWIKKYQKRLDISFKYMKISYAKLVENSDIITKNVRNKHFSYQKINKNKKSDKKYLKK